MTADVVAFPSCMVLSPGARVSPVGGRFGEFQGLANVFSKHNLYHMNFLLPGTPVLSACEWHQLHFLVGPLD